MDDELNSLHEQQVFGSVQELPRGSRPIGYKWVFAKKRDASGSVARYKARLVAKGFTQVKGVDYDETYSPVTDAVSYRVLLAIAAKNKYAVEAMDVVTAYLYGSLNEEMYIDVPEGIEIELPGDFARPVVRLRKALYGLKQSGNVWFNTLTRFMKKNDFNIHESFPCLFTKTNGTDFVVVSIYVDDLLFVGTPKSVSDAKETLKRGFKVKDLGRLTHSIGLQLDWMSKGLFMSQSTFIKRLLAKYNMSECNSVTTPMEKGGERSLYGPKLEDEAPLGPSTPYRTAIGELMWLSGRTRPDIAFAVNVLARNCNQPTERHWKGVKRVLKYLKRTNDLGVLFAWHGSAEVTGFADAGFKSDPLSARSQCGYLFKLGDSPIAWRSTKQTVVATSTAQAELIALFQCTREAVWLGRLLRMLAEVMKLETYNVPIPLMEDNQACIQQVQPGYVPTSDFKHVDPMYHSYIRQENNVSVVVRKIASEDNPADLFTKALDPSNHARQVRNLGLVTRDECGVTQGGML
jgi:hypothetical protein